MREMGWSWPDLQAAPPYVLRYCTDLMMIRRQAESDAAERASKEARRA